MPIHFFVDPGVSFKWPLESELSNEIIDLYPNSKEARMEILEKYLDISKEYSSINDLVLPSATNRTPPSTITDTNSNLESSSEISAVTSTKKPSRSSIHAFSKIIRRTLLNPLATGKRFSLKHHSSSQPRQTSPQLSSPTKFLTVTLVQFQPKRPQTSDYMIKNYIETCIQEYKPKLTEQNEENLTIKQSPKKTDLNKRHSTKK